MPGSIFGIALRPTTGQGFVWSEALGGRIDVGTFSVPGSALTGLTLNRIPFGNALGGVQDSANLTFDGSALTLAGTATINSDADGTTILGRAKVGTAYASDVATWSHFDQANSTGYALTQGTTGSTSLNAASGQTLFIKNADTEVARFNSTTFRVASGAITTFNDPTASTVSSDGAVVVIGGVGIGGALNVAGAVKLTSLTSTRIPYAGAGGLLTDHAGLTYDGASGVTIGDGTALCSVLYNGAAATERRFRFQTAGVDRWKLYCDSTAESGSDAGSDFKINARTDAGASIDNPIFIARVSGGAITLARPITVSTASSGITIAKTTGTTLAVSSTTDATTASAASTTLAGGLGVAKNAIIGKGLGWGVTSTATAAGTTTLTTSSTAVQVFTGSTTQTVTLPAANAFGAAIGYVVMIKNVSSGNVTVNRAGSDTINDTANVTSKVVASFGSLTLVSDGVSAWEVI